MFKITVEEASKYQYVVDFGYEMVAQSFKSWFQTQTSSSKFVRSYNASKGKMEGKRIWNTELFPFWREGESDPCKVRIYRGHLEWLAYWIFKGPGKSM